MGRKQQSDLAAFRLESVAYGVAANLPQFNSAPTANPKNNPQISKELTTRKDM